MSAASAEDLLAGGDGGLAALRGWPHADTLNAMRGAVANGDEDALPWLMVLDAGAERGVIGDLGWKGGPGPDGDVELGWGVAAPYRRHGYATEAVRALLSWLDAQPDVRRVWAEVLLDNVPSRALVARVGFELDRVDEPYAWFVRSSAT